MQGALCRILYPLLREVWNLISCCNHWGSLFWQFDDSPCPVIWYVFIFQMWFKSCLMMMLWPCLSSSGFISSISGALFFQGLDCCKNLLSWEIIHPDTLIFYLTTAVQRSHVVAGTGWLSTFSKCITHLSFCTSSIRGILPSLSMIGTSCYFTYLICLSQFYIVFSSLWDKLLSLLPLSYFVLHIIYHILFHLISHQY